MHNWSGTCSISMYLPSLTSMKPISFIFILLLSFSASVLAQESFLDTFIWKDGIYPVPSFTTWQNGTLFLTKKSKGKAVNDQPILSVEAAERLKHYTTAYSNQKTEPYRFFRVIEELEAHDSSTYFERIDGFPLQYTTFFKGLYFLEYNEFEKADSLFNILTNSTDSFLYKEVSFWKTTTQKLLSEKKQHNAMLQAYSLQKRFKTDSIKLMSLLQQINLPQYMMHKYINLYNHYYRHKNYEFARSTYDSIVVYVNQSKMKASLTKNRAAVLEMLEDKLKFIAAVKNGLYHYEIDYLYDHLELWLNDTLTDKEFASMAGFSLHQRSTTKADSIFTRRLIDTASNEALSKFETLSLIRTPLDKGGRRFLVVKLGFTNEDTYKKYVSFLSKFKSKPIQQSVLYGGIREGDEYMLTQYFIAALYHKNDPMIKYELSLYAIQDSEGNIYAVDTLF